MSTKKPFVCKIIECQPLLRTGRVCKHLEKLLPKPTGQSIRTQQLPWKGAVADFQGKQIFPFDSKVTTIQEFHEELYKYDLPAEDIDLLASRFFYMDTWPDTTRELGYTTEGSARHHYKQVIYRLRARMLAGKVESHEDNETEDTFN